MAPPSMPLHNNATGISPKKIKKKRKEETGALPKKRKKKRKENDGNMKRVKMDRKESKKQPKQNLLPAHQYILAPMVGASELAFRLLCRKYGAQLAYTPMMSSSEFARDPDYRAREFQTIAQDRPLVCHFSANQPDEFAQAAKLCENQCDAIDLNLGCPQRTAHVGHFGSYLLGEEDRKLVLDIVRAGARAVSIPIFVKIRLLDQIEETIRLCQQLRDAGASLIAVHARYRASFERKGPGARDGPAMLDQVQAIKRAVPDIPIIANGNVITYEDVVKNLTFTGADGIMSAEGILDNPALFLPRLGSRQEGDKTIVIADPSPISSFSECGENENSEKKRRKLNKRLRKIQKIEALIQASGSTKLGEDQRKKLGKKAKILQQLSELDATDKTSTSATDSDTKSTTTKLTLGDLYNIADDRLKLANEYLALVRRYPIKIRTVVFHTRRMLKDLLTQYQLMEECVSCENVDQVQNVIDRCQKYQSSPESFIFDRQKAAKQKEALEKKRREEGKRKAFEARMIRKAKREGKTDLEYYLRIGAAVPTRQIIRNLKALPRDQQLALWKKDHSQHCMSFHLDKDGCKRDRACAFLHTDATGKNTFVESDEIAG